MPGMSMSLPPQPAPVDTHLQQADTCLQCGQLAPALALYRTAAALAQRAGDLRRAFAIHERIAALDPDPSRRLPVAELLRASGQPARAAALLDETVRDECRARRLGHALVAAQAAWETEPTPTRRWQLGEVFAHLGRTAEAIEHLHASAAAELAAGRLRRFHTIARRIVALVPEHIPTLRLMLDAFSSVGDVHRAVAVIRLLRACAPEDRAAIEDTAAALELLGKPEAAAAARRLPRAATRPTATAPYKAITGAIETQRERVLDRIAAEVHSIVDSGTSASIEELLEIVDDSDISVVTPRPKDIDVRELELADVVELEPHPRLPPPPHSRRVVATRTRLPPPSRMSPRAP